MDWTTFTYRFLEAKRADSASPNTIDAYRRDCEAFSRWYIDSTGEGPSPEGVTQLDVAEYRGYLCRTWQPATVNRRLAAIKSAYSWAAVSGVVGANPALAVRLVPEVQHGPKAPARNVLSALLREAQRSGKRRDVVFITFLAQTGLRISEALALTWDDVIMRERSGHVRIDGKGGKERIVPLNITVRTALAGWRDESGDPSEGDCIFPGRFGDHWSKRAAQEALKRYSRRAGLDESVTPHMLRHYFGKGLVDGGESLDRVADLMGHSSLNTTRRYTKATIKDLERAVERLNWM